MSPIPSGFTPPAFFAKKTPDPQHSTLPHQAITITGYVPVFEVAAGGAVLALSIIASSFDDPSSPHRSDVGFRFSPDAPNGRVEVLVGGWTGSGGVWTPVNDGVEWINDGGVTDNDYRVRIGARGGDGPIGTLVGPPLGTWWNLGSSGNVWTMTNLSSGVQNWWGTATIEEIGNPANSVTCNIDLTTDNTP
jgi:hypothetical protein